MQFSITDKSNEANPLAPSRQISRKEQEHSLREHDEYAGTAERYSDTGAFHNFMNIPIFASSPMLVQPKLKINTPGDAYEQEADQMAEQVMRMPGQVPQIGALHSPHPMAIQRKCAECENDEREEGVVMRQEQSLPAQSVGSPQQSGGSSLYLPRRIQTVRRDFHDPNFCFHAGSPRDATRPDMNKVVAVMQAEIETPRDCNGIVILRTSIIDSQFAWGAPSGQFEVYGGGSSQGIYTGLNRNLNGGMRVDFEEHFSLDRCYATFSRCHLITFTEGNTKYTFAEAGYRPEIIATSGPNGTVFRDGTPAPILNVSPCNHISPTLC